MNSLADQDARMTPFPIYNTPCMPQQLVDARCLFVPWYLAVCGSGVLCEVCVLYGFSLPGDVVRPARARRGHAERRATIGVLTS